MLGARAASSVVDVLIPKHYICSAGAQHFGSSVWQPKLFLLCRQQVTLSPGEVTSLTSLEKIFVKKYVTGSFRVG